MIQAKIVMFFILTVAFSFGFIFVVHGIGAGLFISLALVEPEIEDIEEWVQEYIKYAGWCGIGVTSLGTILWYILTQYAFRVVEYKQAGKRKLWIGLFIFPLIGALVSLLVLMFHPLQSGIPWVVLLSIIVPFFCYWFVTVLFSPISYKYTPWGASRLRYW